MSFRKAATGVTIGVWLWAMGSPVLAEVPVVTTEPATSEPPTTQPGFQLDRSRYLPIDQIRRGMKGYGLSVFRDAQVEKFDVEVLSVFRRFKADGDVILVRCSGQDLENSAIVAGMSGSPIYLPDPADGQYKMIGAIAYGWGFSKDPISGVQPIAQMLRLPEKSAATQPARARVIASSYRSFGEPASTPLDVLSDVVLGPAPFASADVQPSMDLPAGLTPLGVPLIFGNAQPGGVQRLGHMFAGTSLVPMAGASASLMDAHKFADVKIEPGSVLAVPIVRGDMSITAIGTATEVNGDRVWAFGHSMLGQGDTRLPVSTGMVHSVIPSYARSIKLGSSVADVGTMIVDETTAVLARLGESPPLVPVSVTLHNSAGTQQFNYEIAKHPIITGRTAILALFETIAAHRDPPPLHTLTFDVTMRFDEGPSVTVGDVIGDGNGPERLQQALVNLVNLMTASPAGQFSLAGVSAEVKVEPQLEMLELVGARLARSTIAPGEPLDVVLTLRSVTDGTVRQRTTRIALPAELVGTQQVVIQASTPTFQAILADEPALRQPASPAELVSLLQRATKLRSDELYARIRFAETGVTTGRLSLPAIPTSRVDLLADKGSAGPYVRSQLTTIPVGSMVRGQATLTFTVDPLLTR